jgi:hypothetical protein
VCGENVELLNVKLAVHIVDCKGPILMAILSPVLVPLLCKNSYKVTHTVHYILISYFSTSPLMPNCNCTSVDKYDFTDMTGHLFTLH